MEYFDAILNLILLCGMGIYLTYYCFRYEIEVTTGIPLIAGTLMGYGAYSSFKFVTPIHKKDLK